MLKYCINLFQLCEPTGLTFQYLMHLLFKNKTTETELQPKCQMVSREYHIYIYNVSIYGLNFDHLSATSEIDVEIFWAHFGWGILQLPNCFAFLGVGRHHGRHVVSERDVSATNWPCDGYVTLYSPGN